MSLNYRITKCMFNPNTEYVRIAKCAIVDGIRHEIHKTPEGEEYFEINNPYFKSSGDAIKDDMAELFYNRFTDAIQAVRDGYAHAILGNPNPINVFQRQSRPIYFLDETLGEEYRQKTIKGFKDAKFGFNVKFGSKNSFGGYNLLDKDLKSIGWFNPGIPAFFETYEEAESFIMKAFNKAKSAADLLVKSEGKTTLDEVFDSLDMSTVISDMFFDLIESDSNEKIRFKNGGKLTDYGYSIVQAIEIKE